MARVSASTMHHFLSFCAIKQLMSGSGEVEEWTDLHSIGEVLGALHRYSSAALGDAESQKCQYTYVLQHGIV
jgi:hypothetical protein